MKVIVIGIVIVLLALLFTFLILRVRHQDERREAQRHGLPVKGDLTARQERALLDRNAQADLLLRSLLTPPADMSVMGTMTILSVSHRAQIEGWLQTNARTITATRGV